MVSRHVERRMHNLDKVMDVPIYLGYDKVDSICETIDSKEELDRILREQHKFARSQGSPSEEHVLILNNNNNKGITGLPTPWR